ncbi:hypothetical protein SH528x_004269 [Novipirellula sp. SH528]|uniref:hypothetical protein n=1 Tax=Novipirellula sp. SH528 TaxID=3454466 RepID=UPI003FA0A818
MDDFALGMVDDATEHANNLAEWFNKGGLPPVLRISIDGVKVFTVSDQLAREVCRVASSLICRKLVAIPSHEETPAIANRNL